jgi:hypothetical protein
MAKSDANLKASQILATAPPPHIEEAPKEDEAAADSDGFVDGEYLCACCSAQKIVKYEGQHTLLSLSPWAVKQYKPDELGRLLRASWESLDPHFVAVFKFFFEACSMYRFSSFIYFF